MDGFVSGQYGDAAAASEAVEGLRRDHRPKALGRGIALRFSTVMVATRTIERGSFRALPKILVVEDDALIAMELGERLSDLGYEVLGPAHSISEAEALLAREQPDGALLDANLAHGASSVPLAMELVAAGVRIAFCTGYDHVKNAPAELSAAPVLTKPVSDAALKAALEKLIA